MITILLTHHRLKLVLTHQHLKLKGQVNHNQKMVNCSIIVEQLNRSLQVRFVINDVNYDID